MKVYRFDQEVGKEVGVYGSRDLVMSKILMSEEGVPVNHADEWHESGSESGMTVIVVEGPPLEPDMPEAEVQPYS